MTESILEQCALGVAFVDATGVVVRANSRFQRIFGMQEGYTGWILPSQVCLPPDLSGAIGGCRPWRGMVTASEETGDVFVEVVPLECDGGVDIPGVMLMIRPKSGSADIDAPDRRWEYLSRFTSGLTHEINNALASIQGFAEIAAASAASNPAMLERCLGNIQRGVALARDGVQQGRVMGGRAEIEQDCCNLADVAHGWTAVRRATLPPEIRLELDMATDLPDVLLDARSMEVGFYAVWDNAVSAMEHGGILRISVQPGGSVVWPVMLEVLDTGVGMPANVLERCTEPYFTTREATGSKGVGLALAHGLVRAHGGRMAVDSVPGNGTVVRMWFQKR